MWSCSSPRKKTQRKNRRPAKQKTPRILPIWGRVLGVLFRYRSIWHKCAACIQRMQYTKGLGLSQQAFCNAKMAFVYTNALLAGWYNVIDETKIVSSQTVIWLCRFPKHSNIEVLTGAESGKTACLVSIQELLTA